MVALQPFAKPADLMTLMPSVDEASAVLALDLISGAIRDSIGWDVDQKVGDVYTRLIPRGYHPPREIVLPAKNVTAVSSVVINGTTIDPSRYTFTTDAGVLYLTDSYGWWPVPGGSPLFYQPTTVAVTYTHGYVRAPEDQAPSILRLVALDYAAQLIGNPDSVKSQTRGLISETFGPGSKALADGDSRLDLLRVNL